MVCSVVSVGSAMRSLEMSARFESEVSDSIVDEVESDSEEESSVEYDKGDGWKT